MQRISKTTSLKRDPSQIFSKIDDEVVMLSMKEGKYFALNEAGTRIWEIIEHPIKVQSLIDNLMDEFNVSKNKCELETLELLNDLYKKRLVIIC